MLVLAYQLQSDHFFQILQHHPFKLMHLIYRQAGPGLASQFWPMQITLESSLFGVLCLAL